MAKAATPSNTFCADLMITLYCSAVSPINFPDATTAAVVSIVPPNHAPATCSLNPIHLARNGKRYIMGMATISTSETINDSFFGSPFMAPQVAMAAETPQMETELDSIIDISESTPILRETQKLKYQTQSTTITA